MEGGPGVPPTKYLEKSRVKGHNSKPTRGAQRELFGLGVERRVDQGDDKERRSPQKRIIGFICFNHVFEG